MKSILCFDIDHQKKEAFVSKIVDPEKDKSTNEQTSLSPLCRYYLNESMAISGEIIIPETAPDCGYAVTGINESAFSNCPFITSIRIPKTISRIDWNMYKCESLERFIVDPDNQFYKDIDGVLYSKDGKELIAFPNKHSVSYKIPYGTRHIKMAFKGCFSIEEIILPKTITEIHDNAFYGCVNLDYVIIPDSVIPKKIGKYHRQAASGKLKEPSIIYKGVTYKSINDIKRD